ncbi:MAG: Uma2 family endonuclease [Alphaproteobacteria bacterium]|jgi:Uma2 family endonuclease|nr:Uma2 family endonuclease [Alphaproteobacteria bacterium]
MTAIAKTEGRRFTVAAYLDWLERQAEPGRYELVAGVPVAMAPERVQHMRVKARVWRGLSDAISAAGVACEALPDGATVQVDETTAFEPDASVNCGDPLPGDTVILPNPVIVVEVLSPGTASIDTGRKLAGYFTVPSIRHYLIVDAEKRLVIHHDRTEAGLIETGIVTAGNLVLDPPGLTIAIDRFFD